MQVWKTARGHRTSLGRTVLPLASPARHGSSLMGKPITVVLLAPFSILDVAAIISGSCGKVCDDYAFHKSCLSDAKKSDQRTHSAFDITGVISVMWYLLFCLCFVLKFGLCCDLVHYQDSLD